MEARIVVEIMPCGTKAKTVNPISKLCPIVPSVAIPFNFFKREEALLQRKKWQQAERECKVYDIDCWVETNGGQTMDYIPRWEPGSIHEATEINTKQIRIL